MFTSNSTYSTSINSSTFSENDFLNEFKDEAIQEAFEHFSRKFLRIREDDTRYFFNEKDVNFIIGRLAQCQISVKVEYIYNNDKAHSIFCYAIKPVSSGKETRKRNKEVK